MPERRRCLARVADHRRPSRNPLPASSELLALQASRASRSLAAPLAPPAQAQLPAPVVLQYDDQEQLAEKRTDTNGDGRHDEVVFYEDGKPERAESDTNYDGRVDLWITYDADGKPAAQERDTNGDGKRDQWIQLEDGVPRNQRDDKNGDGKPDATLHFARRQPEQLEEDANFDGRIDRW